MLGRLIASRIFNTALFVAILITAALYFWLPDGRFDRARWLAADPATRTRADMAEDLVARYRLERRTDIQIINLLGEPTRTDRWPGRELAYELGPRRFWQSGRSEWLLIDLNEAGRVTRLELAHD